MYRLSTVVFFIFASISTANESTTAISLSGNQSLTKGTWYKPTALTTWHWQLNGKINTTYSTEIYDIDLFDTSPAVIKKLQKKGKRVICYFSAGSSENWRPDFKKFTSKITGKPLDEWPGERWIDIRSNIVHSIMKTRLDLAVEKGCDGVEPDNMDAYTNNSGFKLTSQDQLDFNRLIANEAHKRNLSIGLKNDLEQITELVDYYDFAINEQCFEYSECDQLIPFIKQNKAVFNAEYQKKWVNNKKAQNKLCEASIKRKFHTLILPMELDNQFRISCR